jgi:hypothetical protein
VDLQDYFYQNMLYRTTGTPPYMFLSFRAEDFLYSFFFGGFASECADIIYEHKIKKHKRRLYLLFVILFFVFFTFTCFLYYYKINSIVSHFFPLLFVGLLSIGINVKNMKHQVMSGLITILP